MLLTLFCLLVTLLILRSCILLIWRNKKDKKLFAPIHLMIIVAGGFFSFCLMYLMALGSTGHYVVSDFEEMMGELALGITIMGTFLGIIGFFIAIIVWTKNSTHLKQKKNFPG